MHGYARMDGSVCLCYKCGDVCLYYAQGRMNVYDEETETGLLQSISKIEIYHPLL